MKRVTCVLTLALMAGAATALPARATPGDPNFGRFLPEAGTGFILSYGQANPVAFDKNVFCGDIKCGEIKFDYATYLQKPDGKTRGGAALSGGFYISPGLKLAAGDKLVWVQTVQATLTGENDWGIDPAKGPFEFPDADRTSPAYPFTTTAAPPPNPPGKPTLGYQDFPSRRFAKGDQFWQAELGLVCLDGVVNGVTQAFVIDTFLWGFNVQADPKQIISKAPSFFGPPTATYLATLNSYYSGAPPMPPTSGGTSTKFNFQSGCDDCFVKKCDGNRCAVPEPSSHLLFALAVLSAIVLGRFGNRAD